MVKSEKLIENAMGKYILRKLIKIIEANGQINTHKPKQKKHWNNKWQSQSY